MNEKANEAALAPRATQPAHLIRSEAEAVAVARELAEGFRMDAVRRDRERQLPHAEIERYSASGLGAITVPRGYGGLEASNETVVKVFALISEADPSLGQIPQSHFALIQNLKDSGSTTQKQRWFGDVLAGQRIGNAGPERKARAALLTDATARLNRTAKGLRVNGTRFYSTGALFAHWVPFRAIDDEDRAVQVWVRRDAPGLTVVDDWDGFGQRTTASGTVRLDEVAVAEDDVVQSWRFAAIPTLSGPFSQLLQCAIDAGIARGALAAALEIIRGRAGAGSASDIDPAGPVPGRLLEAIGELKVTVDGACAVVLETARRLDALARQPIDEARSAEASVAVAEAKILSTEAALRASEQLVALAAAADVDASTEATRDLDRYWRNARVHTLHDPVRWKALLVGNYLLNGVAPQRHQWN